MSGNHRRESLTWVAAAGAALLVAGTLLHPMGADPNDPAAAFAEYAVDTWWVASHLTQFAGMALIVAALVSLSEIMATGPARRRALLGAAGAIVSLALAAALQAVDGVALKVMVDRWAAAAGADKAMAFHAAIGVRQVEIGLASLMSLVFGSTIIVYGLAVLAEPWFSRWLAWLAMVSGAGLLVHGTVTAYTGFSSLSMNISMPSTVALLAWLTVVTLRARSLPPAKPVAGDSGGTGR